MQGNLARNVLVIMTDQQRYSAAGWMGNPWVQTPHLDALAAGGTVFERAYTPAPLCVPARQSLLTGRLPHAHGAISNGRAMDAGERTIGHLAKDAGFATGAIGKMHFIGPDQHQGFDTRWDILDYYQLEPQACGDAASGMAAPGCYGRYRPGVEGSAAEGPNPMRVRNGNYDAQASPFPAERHVEAHTTREAIRFLEAHRDERWVLWCSYFKPHAPYSPPPEDWERYAGLPIPIPPVDDALIDSLPLHSKQLRRRTGIDTLDEAGIRRCLAGYYSCVSFVDREAGKVLEALEALGLYDDTLIVFTSDHGDMIGSHGLLAKGNFYEDSWHIPLIVSHPAYRGAGQRTTALACLTDLLPTIAESTGLPVPAGVHGWSQVPVIASARDTVRDHVYSELHTGSDRFSGVCDGTWKLASYTDRAQLFHLPSDPEERVNLIDQAQGHDVRLRGIMQRTALLA
jgi:choline-sulfatase